MNTSTAKKWPQVTASPAYQALNDDDREAARQQYWQEVVQPQLDPADYGVARGQFDADTSPPKVPAHSTPAAAVSKVDQARAAGYSDDEIADFLAQSDQRVATARRHGYTGQEILAELARVTPVSALPERDTLSYEQQPQQVISQRGGKRGEAQPYVAGQDPADATAAQARRAFAATDPRRLDRPGQGVLDKPVPGFQPSRADLIEQSKAPATREAEARALKPLPTIWAYTPGISERASRAVADATGSRDAAALAGRVVDTALLAPEATATGLKFGADIANLATLGAAQPVSDWLGATVQAVNQNKSTRYQQQAAELGRLLKSDQAGVVDVLQFLAAHPGFAAELAVPSLPSMLVGAGAGRAAGALNAAVAARRGATGAELAGAFQTGARAGSAAGNALMNAGGTFSETDGTVVQKLAAAGAAAAGTALAGKYLEGAEHKLAMGTKPGVRGLVNTAASEGTQESIEAFSQQLGKGTAEGNFDLDQALKQSALEGGLGAMAGGGAAAVQGKAQQLAQRSAVPGAADYEALARQKLGTAYVEPETSPGRQAADAAPATAPAERPAPGLIEAAMGATARPGGRMPDFGAALARADEELAGQDPQVDASGALQPSALPEATTSFTPADSVSAKAGLAPIAVRGVGLVGTAMAGTPALAPAARIDIGGAVQRLQSRFGQEAANGQPLRATPRAAVAPTQPGDQHGQQRLDGQGQALDAATQQAPGGLGGGQASRPAVHADVQPAQPGIPGGATAVSGRGTDAPGVDAQVVARDLKNIADYRLKRTKELVDLEVVDIGLQPELAGIARAMQVPITFIRDRKGKATFGAVAAASSRVYVNVDSDEAPVALVMHEAVHTMPADIKEALIDRVMATVSPEQRDTFLGDYKNYRSLEPAKQDEELVAMLTQEDAKQPEFWSRLADKLGEGNFKAVVQHILRTIDSLLQGFTAAGAGRYTRDMLEVREAVTDAFAATAKRRSGARQQDQAGDEQAAPARDAFTPVAFADTGKPEAFQRWFGDSKVVDTRGRPLQVYHGTKSPSAFDIFETRSGGDFTASTGWYGSGAYFSNRRSAAAEYGQRIYRVYLSLQNPAMLYETGSGAGAVERSVEIIRNLNQHMTFDEVRRLGEVDVGASSLGEVIELVFDSGHEKRVSRVTGREHRVPLAGERFREVLESAGHDGIIIDGTDNKAGLREYVAFAPGQIKSAVGNRGTFDANDPRIDFSEGKAPASAKSAMARASTRERQRPTSSRSKVQEEDNAWLQEIGAGIDTAADPETIDRDLRRLEECGLEQQNVLMRLRVVDQTARPELAAIARSMLLPMTFIEDRQRQAFFGAVVMGRERIYINVDARQAPLAMLMHEVLHAMPEDLRATMVEKVMATVTPRQRKKFLDDYSFYQSVDADLQNEELVAMLAEEDSKQPAFWTRLAEKMGESDFGRLARHILGVLNRLIGRAKKPKTDRYTTDMVAVREAITDAYAQTAQRRERLAASLRAAERM